MFQLLPRPRHWYSIYLIASGNPKTAGSLLRIPRRIFHVTTFYHDELRERLIAASTGLPSPVLGGVSPLSLSVFDEGHSRSLGVFYDHIQLAFREDCD